MEREPEVAVATIAPGAGYVPPYVRAVRAEAAAAGLARLRAAPRGFDPRTPVLIAVVRNETAMLPEWLDHYRSLGIERFALIDNGSSDGTPALLGAEPDVDLYATRRRFSGKQGWVTALIARYGHDRWYLHVDADEHVVFDGAGPRTLPDLVAAAEAQGLRRVRGMLVDMYAPGPLLGPLPDPLTGPLPDLAPAGPAPVSGRRLGERFRLFDGDPGDEALCLERISRKGGPRRRRFSRPGEDFAPELTKYPLFHIRAGEVAASPHHLFPYRENYASDCLIGILHYKFTDAFLAKARRARAEGNYWSGSYEYRRYLEVLERDPRLELAFPGTRTYRDPADLVAAGLIAPVPWSGRRGQRWSVAGLGRRLRSFA